MTTRNKGWLRRTHQKNHRIKNSSCQDSSNKFNFLGAKCLLRNLFLGNRLFIRPPIGEALAHNPSHQTIRAGQIVHAHGDTVGVAEIELGKVAVQVAFAAMLVDALHAALEDRIEALDGIGGDELRAFVTDIFFILVQHAVMAGEVIADNLVVVCFVSHQGGVTVHIGANDAFNVKAVGAVYM